MTAHRINRRSSASKHLTTAFSIRVNAGGLYKFRPSISLIADLTGKLARPLGCHVQSLAGQCFLHVGQLQHLQRFGYSVA